MEDAVTNRQTTLTDFPDNEAYSSGVSWTAVIAGAFVLAALSLILLDLGSGLGLSSVSPWRNRGLSALTISIGAIVWLIVSQILASAMGGYVAGRLRTKWTIIHSDEVYFRDTAHGFLVWAVGLVITAAFLTSAAISMAGDIVRNPSSTIAGSAPAGEDYGYYRDMLFRSNHFGPNRIDPYLQTEVDSIFAHALAAKALSDPDRMYLTRMVADKTDLTVAEAQNRVDGIFSRLQQNTNLARKTAAQFSLWLFVALLAGAFFASYAATIGGTERDRVKAVEGRPFKIS
jgi:hypothetical protein